MKRYIRDDCYALKNRNNVASATNKRKQPINIKVDVIEVGKVRESFL